MTDNSTNETCGFISEKLYSPLFVNKVADDNRDYYNGDYWRDPISQREAVNYADSIQEALLKERDRLEDPRGLMTYYNEDDPVDAKVHSLYVDVEEHCGKLWGVATIELAAALTPEELAVLKDYLSGQYSDGFGEGFEQREIAVSDGELFVGLWESGDKFFIDTSMEFEQRFGFDNPLVDRSAIIKDSPDKPGED
jgi:hypothetical protein